MSRPDVLIVGAGMVGAWTALVLAEQGLRVRVLERQFAGAGSTGAAMGHLVVMDDSPAQLALCRHAMARWQAIAPSLPASAEYDSAGTLWLAADDAEMAEATRKAAVYREAGLAAEVLDAAGLRDAEPAVAPGLAGALRVPGDAICYPPTIAKLLLERAVARGAEVIADDVIRAEGGAVHTANGTRHEAAHVVIAAGPHSSALVPGLPLVPRRGHLAITERAPRIVRHQLVELGYLHSAHTLGGASVAFNVQPRTTGQLLVGSSRELVGFDPGPNRALLGMMLERAIARVPLLARLRVLRTWTGFRPATPDALPLIGAWGDDARLLVATGHEGLGITLAPATADLIAAQVTGRAAPVDPTPFAPTRAMPAVEAHS
ncbi:MAG TPA: FAD-dependent oxidoreductase [Gemmatimonadales bacterium]|nr:FAD-dependent oxidoreductase [Gemmatimonadales bacterium]